eukprot:TRINITY_DN4077_c0_g1_i2.p1 TRINITY_DN4077_c0_g1~~TRINITY_DN4077_c0_g1_i2.p1  ORF type:complete len:135 (-),score=36.11 TRINITY_DN4077_c0_g1_i2:127-531(-)
MAIKNQSELSPELIMDVLKDLKQRNKEFFEGYGILLKLKDQISAFNHVVSQIARKIFEQEEKEQQQQTRNSLSNASLSDILQNGNNELLNAPQQGSLFEFKPTGVTAMNPYSNIPEFMDYNIKPEDEEEEEKDD